MLVHAARLLAGSFAATGMIAIVAALVALRSGTSVAAFVGTAAFCIFLAGALRFTTSGLPSRPGRAQGISGLLLVWCAVPVASIPAIAGASGLAPLAAGFEAASAFTTTGITALSRGPESLFTFLALLQWTGGLFTIVSALTILAPAGIGGLPDRASREAALDAVEIGAVVREVTPIYAAGTLVLILLLLMDGHSFYVAFTLSTAVTASGAHLPPEAQNALLVDPNTKWLVMPFLLWSATSVRWHVALTSGRLRGAPEQLESLLILGWFVMLGVVFGSWLTGYGTETAVEAVRDGFFTAASLISTSGIGAPDGTYAHLPHGLVLGVALVGGGIFSVAGGLKMLRLRAILLRIRGDLTRLISPNLVQPAALAEGGVGSAMRGVWIGIAMLFLVFGATVIALSPGMPNLGAAVAAAIAVVANCGPVYDAAGQGWPPLSSLPPASVLAGAGAMIAGRLEIIGIFVVVHLALWRI